jgi:hypothetical protein
MLPYRAEPSGHALYVGLSRTLTLSLRQCFVQSLLHPRASEQLLGVTHERAEAHHSKPFSKLGAAMLIQVDSVRPK